MKLPILTRFANAASMVFKGSWIGANFNRIPIIDGDSNERLKEPFKNSVWVMRAIKKIAGPISAVALKFRDPATDQEITGEPWLPFWKHPARGLSYCDFIEAMVGWLKVAGEDFIVLQPEFTAPFPEVVKGWPPFILVRPDDMQPVKDGEGLIGWEMTDARGQKIKLPPEQVVQPKYWNPYDKIRGLSEYSAAQVASEADYLSGKFALHIAQNNGDQGLIIAAKGQLEDGQREQITAQLREKRRRQQRGEFVPIFISGEVDVKDPKISSVDANFVAQRLENRHEIFAAFGVPMSMADVTQSYSIGSASDRYLLIEEACIPTGGKLAEAISAVASRMAGREVEAYFDWDEHPVMQQVRRERIDSAVKLTDKGMPMATASEYLDLDLPRYPGDSIGYLPFSVAAVDAPMPPKPDDEEFAESENEPNYERSIRSLRDLIRKGVRNESDRRQDITLPKFFELCCCPIHGKADAHPQNERPVREVAHWRSLMTQRLPTVRAYEAKIGKVLYEARAEVLRKLERAGSAKSITKSGVADFLFDLAEFAGKFQAAMRSVGATALQTAGQQFFAEIKRDDPFTMPPQKALDFLDTRENKLSGVPQEVFDQVKRTLQEGLNGGESIKELSDRVRTEFNTLEKGRAVTVAMTETAAAYGTARHEAMKQAGITHKKWLTSGNANVRVAHRNVNGATVPIDQPFLVMNPKTGETDRVMHPGDPDGEPWNVINCHCVSLATADDAHGGQEE